MIKFEEITLNNGLKVVANYDPFTPMATLNILYKVGSKHENPEQTGMAHLFEHLMFSGSANVEDFDAHVENAGGSNNAYTTSDYTNYYITLPAVNIETAFWLESDRMAEPVITQQKLDVQKNVVIEEYKQRTLNPPYGDVMLNFLPLIYQQHSYKWPVIGKNIQQIEAVNLDIANAFHARFYHPSNAVLSVSGNVKPEKVFELAQKWFGDIARPAFVSCVIEKEPLQTASRRSVLERDVPLDAIFMAWPMQGRDSTQFVQSDLLTDLLSFDRSSRFYQLLNKEHAVFAELDAHVSGTIDNGTFVVSGKLNPEFTIDNGISLIEDELSKVKSGIAENEVLKVRNKAVTSNRISRLDHSNKAPALAFAAMLGNTNHVNTSIDDYLKVTADDMQKVATEIIQDHKANVLIYTAKNKLK